MGLPIKSVQVPFGVWAISLVNVDAPTPRVALPHLTMLKLHEVLEGLVMLYMAREAHVQTIELIRSKKATSRGPGCQHWFLMVSIFHRRGWREP